nr:immunoglobulin heavy chain junction region [Macaca mulatta]MOX65823.1 immunoglobulin heavy chain junction region [Macaca mulatta]MOX68860.1 immunoglobulin heavy chain junction region [Macaca mulatta]
CAKFSSWGDYYDYRGLDSW